MRRDLHSNILSTPALNPQAIASSTTTTGATIDCKGYGVLEFLLQSATITDGTYTPGIFVGNASNMSDEVAINVADLIGTYALSTFISTDDNVCKRIGVKLGTFRYCRLKIVSTGVTTGGTLAAQAVLATPAVAAVAG